MRRYLARLLRGWADWLNPECEWRQYGPDSYRFVPKIAVRKVTVATPAPYKFDDEAGEI